MKGYICRSENSNQIIISVGSKPPQKDERGWYHYVPGWFNTISVRSFKRVFGFSIKPGAHKSINIVIENGTHQ